MDPLDMQLVGSVRVEVLSDPGGCSGQSILERDRRRPSEEISSSSRRRQQVHDLACVGSQPARIRPDRGRCARDANGEVEQLLDGEGTTRPKLDRLSFNSGRDGSSYEPINRVADKGEISS